jgi:hypothetical protein
VRTPSRLLEEQEQLARLPERSLRRSWAIWQLYALGALGVLALVVPVVTICTLMSGPGTSSSASSDYRESEPAPERVVHAPPPPPPLPQRHHREIRRFEGHTAGVERLAVSPDGRRVLSTSNDQTVRLWDLETGQTIRISPRLSKATHGITYSASGTMALVAVSDATIRLWDLEAIKEIKQFKGHTGTVWGARFSPDGKWIASAGADRTVRLWDAKTGQELLRFEGHTAAVMCVEFSPDGKYLLSASPDHTVRLWDVETGKHVRTFKGHGAGVIMAAFVPDGRRFVSCSYDKTVRLWSVQTGETLRVFQGHGAGVVSVAVSPEGKRILSGDQGGELRLWDLESGACPGPLARHDKMATTVAFTPDGCRALTGGHDNVVCLWRLPPASLGSAARLVGHWKFDEQTGRVAADSSGNAHHGQLAGRPAWTPGKLGGGLRLNGQSDFVRTDFTRQLDTWSIALWVQGQHAPRNGKPAGPIHREKNFQISWDHSHPENRGTALLSSRGKWYPASFGHLEGGRWYHLTATFDGEKLRTYKDGVPMSTVDVFGVADHEPHALALGKHAAGSGYFAGVIDDVRVYERPLSDQDVADLFAGR